MRENDICPRCGHGDLRPLTPGSGTSPGGPDRSSTGFLAFLIWPGLVILCLAGFAPAIVVLAVLGVEPGRAALVIHLVVFVGALAAALLWFLDRHRRRAAADLAGEEGETLRFCPWCETTVAGSRRFLSLATRRAHN